MSDPSVSPADTIRRYIRLQSVCNAGMEPEQREALAALDALLAVGERDKAEIARLTEKRSMALALVQAAVAHVAELEAQGERDRQHIERLTVAIEDYLLWEPGKAGHAEAHRRLRAAVLADKEDADNG